MLDSSPALCFMRNFFYSVINLLLISFPNHIVVVLIFCYIQLSRSNDPDSFIPYLAMNYFDRFLSQHKLNLEVILFVYVSLSLKYFSVETENSLSFS